MSKRFTDTEKWKKAWFRKLQPTYKCFWFFLLDNCDLAGICDVDIEVAEFMIGGDSLDDLPDNILTRIYKIREDRWFIIDFIDFQYGILKPDSRPHQAVINRLKSKGLYSYYLEHISPNAKRTLAHNVKSKDRSFIYHRDNYTCQYCNKKKEITELVIDHIIPINGGGENKKYNYVTACIGCNSEKSDMSLEKYCSGIKNGTDVFEKINTLFNTLYDTLSNRVKEQDKDKYKDTDTIIDYLNECSGGSYRHSKASREHIHARLDDGFSLEDCLAVVEFYSKEWKGTEVEKYLRPTTLFGPKRFEGYVSAAKRWVSQGKPNLKSNGRSFERENPVYPEPEEIFNE